MVEEAIASILFGVIAAAVYDGIKAVMHKLRCRYVW